MNLNMDLGLGLSGLGGSPKEYDVIIIGGGPGGAAAAIYTARADLRTLVIDKGLTAGALGITAEIMAHPKVKIQMGTRLKGIVGETQVEGVRIHPRGGEEAVLPVGGAFVYLQGGQPITDYLMDQLKTSETGCLVVDNEMQTAVPGIFAIGDLLCSHIKQAVIAASDGVIATVTVDKYVHGRKKVQTDWK